MQYKSSVQHFTTYKNGADAIQMYTWIKYADSPTSGMSDLPEGKTYIGLAYNKTSAEESINYDDYQWSLIKGEDGEPGSDGSSYYTWVKYADDINGTNMTDDPTDKYYIGIAYNKDTTEESAVASDYTWSLFRGRDGVDGTDATVKSDTAPTDTTKMWLDTSIVPNILKYFNGNTWVMANDQTNDIDQAVKDMKQTIYDEHISSLIVATDNITSSVKHITETVEGHTSTLQQVSTTVEQNANGITAVKKEVVTVKDDLTKKATKEEIARWANLNGDVLTLGRSDSDFKTQLDSTKLSFLQGQNEIAAAANNEFYGDTMRANVEWKLSELRFRKTKKCYVMQ